MKTILSLLLPILAVYAQAQSDDIRVKLISQAEKMGDAYVRNDLQSYLHFMYKDAVIASGGKDILLKKLQNAKQDAEKLGIKVIQIKYSEPLKIVEHTSIVYDRNKSLQCLLPQYVETKTESLPGELFAISYNNGKKWYFFNMSMVNKDSVLKYIPEFDHRLLQPPGK